MNRLSNYPMPVKVSLGIGLALIWIGALFKIQHWPFGVILSFAGFLSLSLTTVLYYIYRKDKTLLNTLGLIILNHLIYLRMMNLSRTEERWHYYFVFALMLVWGSLYLRAKFFRNHSPKPHFRDVLYYGGGGLIILGAFLKIQHLPGAFPILITGIIAMVCGFFLHTRSSS
jgi:hypothetical protein